MAGKDTEDAYGLPEETGRTVPISGGNGSGGNARAGDIRAFVPNPLPDQPDQVELETDTLNLLAKATLAVEQLNSTIRHTKEKLPTPEIWQQLFTSLEALDSSRIEGTRTTLAEVLIAQAQSTQAQHKLAEADGDVAEVLSCVQAMNTGLELLQKLPISLRFLREVHRDLMDNQRGANKAPGEFRRVQNQIASQDAFGRMTTVFVPPPVPQMHETLDELERFINTPNDLPALIAIGLAHYQFETIHPFLDGNGRSGRLLVLFQMLNQGLLLYPMFPISCFIWNHRRQYYRGLQSVRQRGSFNSWLFYFLHAVLTQANETLQQISELVELREIYHAKLAGDRPETSHPGVLEVLDLAFANPVLTAPRIARELEVSTNKARSLLGRIAERGLISPLSRKGQRGERLWMAHKVFEIVDPDKGIDIYARIETVVLGEMPKT